jgi:hypothetical protein
MRDYFSITEVRQRLRSLSSGEYKILKKWRRGKKATWLLNSSVDVEVIEQGRGWRDMIEAPRGQDCGTRVEIKQSKTRPGKDDDCAQDNAFTQQRCLLIAKEGRLASCRTILDNRVPLPAQRPSQIAPVSRKACEHASIRGYVTFRHHSWLTGSAVNTLLVDSNKIIACIISIC